MILTDKIYHFTLTCEQCFMVPLSRIVSQKSLDALRNRKQGRIPKGSMSISWSLKNTKWRLASMNKFLNKPMLFNTYFNINISGKVLCDYVNQYNSKQVWIVNISQRRNIHVSMYLCVWCVNVCVCGAMLLKRDGNSEQDQPACEGLNKLMSKQRILTLCDKWRGILSVSLVISPFHHLLH